MTSEKAHPLFAAGDDQARAGQFAATLAAAILLMPLFLIGANVWADPREEFGTGRLDPVALDAAGSRLHWLDEQDRLGTLWIMGNSRAAQMSTQAAAPLGHESVSNLYVNRATPWDMMRFFDHVASENDPAALLIMLGITRFADPEGLGPGVLDKSPHGWRVTGERSHSVTAELAARSLQPAYLRDTATAFWRHWTTEPELEDALREDGAQIGFNETLLLQGGRRPSDLFGITERVMHRGLDEQGESNEALWHRFMQWSESVAARGVELHIVALPVHPEWVAMLEPEDNYLRADAAMGGRLPMLCRPGIFVHDVRNATVFDHHPLLWQDGHHMTEQNHARMAIAIADRRADVCAQA